MGEWEFQLESLESLYNGGKGKGEGIGNIHKSIEPPFARVRSISSSSMSISIAMAAAGSRCYNIINITMMITAANGYGTDCTEGYYERGGGAGRRRGSCLVQNIVVV